MKKIALIGAGLVLVLSAAAFAGTSATLTLTGTVPGILDVSVTPSAAASNLDLSSNVAGTVVATVTEKSNKKAGYTVSVGSANASSTGSNQPFFKSADPSNTDQLSYSLTYGGSAVTFDNTGNATITDVTTKTAGTGDSKDLAITFSGAGQNMYEDSYTDTLTFTIVAK